MLYWARKKKGECPLKLKEQVARYLAEHPGEDISGQQLAEQLQVSRAAVWKAIQTLREEGYAITSSTNRGYRFGLGDDPIREADIRAWCPDNRAPITVLDTVDSTNQYARRLADEGASHGAMVVANFQSAGRGRRGRPFYSPAGSGLYLSVILRPTQPMGQMLTITLAAAVAVSQAIEQTTGQRVQIKWVNDLFLGRKKVSGILTEAVTSVESGEIESIIVGIGVNCRECAWPDELGQIAGSLDAQGLSRSRLAGAIWTELMHWQGRLDDPALLETYRARCLLLGRQVRYEQEGTQRYGRALTVDGQGRLLIETADGGHLALQAGDVSVREWEEEE